MSFPPFAVEKWIRIVDSFQIFLPGIFGIIFCISENQFFLVPLCKFEQMRYHWKCFFRWAGSNRYDLRDVWATQSQGWIHFCSTDQSTNPGPFNTKIQKLSVFIPSRRFKDDFRCKHPKSEVC